MEKIGNGQLAIRGFTANALWNKVRAAAQPIHPNPNGGGSRVIRVTGPPVVANVNYLLALFSANFLYDLDGAPKLVHRGYNTASIEFAFAAYLNQAENACHLLNQDRHISHLYGRESGRGRGRGHGGIFGEGLLVDYVLDPCAELGQEVPGGY